MQSLLKLTVYFGVWFCALNLVLHEAHGRTGLPLEAWGLAWVKAFLAAKFLLVGQMLFPIRGLTRDRIWRVVLPPSMVYTLFVVGLSLIERGLLGVFDGQPFLSALTANATPGLVFSLAWICWLIILPYLVIEALLLQPDAYAEQSS